MPFIPIAVVLLFLVVLVLAMPLALVQRYRLGRARRLARGWVATINLVMLTLSAVIFLWAAALTNFWVPDAFRYSLVGLAGGALLGLLGLAVTRWESRPAGLHYTPNRWLVLAITFAVSARLFYGFWRMWQAWTTSARDTSWLAAAGVPTSLAVGAVVLGYYLIYAMGLRWRIGRHGKQYRL